MNFDLSEEQTMLRATLERVVADRSLAQRYPATISPARSIANRETWRSLAELGVLGLPFAAEDGGLGGDAVDVSIVMEALGAGLVPSFYLSTVLLAGGLIDRLSTMPTRRSALDGLMDGTTVTALAHAESGARFDHRHVETRAVRDGSEFVLAGAKTLVLDGAEADRFVVIARSFGDVASPLGLSAFVVHREAPGLAIEPYQLADASNACALRLNDVRVCADALLGGEGAAGPALEAVIARASVALCSEAIGMAATLIDITVEHLRTRRQFGATLASFQVVQHRMAECYLELEVARSITLKALLASEVADRTGWLAAAWAAKSRSARAALHIAEEAVQFHGAIGLTDELVVGHYLKRIRVVAMLFGHPTAMLDSYNNTSVRHAA